jgi:hypothetical protein
MSKTNNQIKQKRPGGRVSAEQKDTQYQIRRVFLL